MDEVESILQRLAHGTAGVLMQTLQTILLAAMSLLAVSPAMFGNVIGGACCCCTTNWPLLQGLPQCSGCSASSDCLSTPCKFQVTLAGFANSGCTDCALLNNTWEICKLASSDIWDCKLPSQICGVASITMLFTAGAPVIELMTPGLSVRLYFFDAAAGCSPSCPCDTWVNYPLTNKLQIDLPCNHSSATCSITAVM